MGVSYNRSITDFCHKPKCLNSCLDHKNMPLLWKLYYTENQSKESIRYNGITVARIATSCTCTSVCVCGCPLSIIQNSENCVFMILLTSFSGFMHSENLDKQINKNWFNFPTDSTEDWIQNWPNFFAWKIFYPV